MGRFGGIIAAGLWLALATCATVHAQEAAAPLVADPAIRRGVLPNGLRYALKQNATPKDGISFRLIFDIGSLEETEEERGAAHFVEHMAFRASRNFPEGELDAAFAPLGVGFGRDQNAFTSFGSTIYLLDLPRSDAAARALAFRWLRDVADGIRFDPAAVDRERGVILAERGARRSPEAILGERVAAFQGPELRTARRPPMGVPESLAAMTPLRLETFYRRWYRPDQAVLVVVGDVEQLTAVEAEISAAFADWRAQGAAPEPVALPGPDRRRGVDALTIAEARMTPSVSICRLTSPMLTALNDLNDLREGARDALWLTILDERLGRLRTTEPWVVNAVMSAAHDRPDATTLCAAASTLEGGWEPALKAMQRELDRFSAEGPSETEFEEALATLRALHRGSITLSATKSSATLATEIATLDLAGRTAMAPVQVLSAFNLAAEGLTEQQVTASWRRAWSGGGPLLTVAGATPPTREAVLAAWSTPAVATAAPDSSAVVWAYGTLGAPGRVIRREVIADPGFVRLTFENGVTLNFKHVKASRALVRADFGAGREELGERTLREADFAADSFVLGGLGRHSYAELRTFFGDAVIGMDLRVTNRSFSLVATNFTSNLESQLLVMSAYLRDPGFREELDPKIPTVVANIYGVRAASPSAVALDGMNGLVGGPFDTPPLAKAMAIRSRDFAALLRSPATKGPLEVTLVGDVDEASATAMVAATFGALPPRPTSSPRAPYAGYRTFPEEAPPVLRLTHNGPADKAAVAVVWPTFVAAPERLREQLALELVAAIFNDTLRHDLRAGLGKTYAPSVEADLTDAGDQAPLYALVEGAPEDAPLIEAEIRAIGERLARGEFGAEALEAARAPLLTEAQGRLGDLEELAWAIRTPARNPRGLAELVEAPGILADLTLPEVRQAAARWLGQPAITITATPESNP